MLERLAGALYGSACGTAAVVPACSVFGLVAAIATASPGWWVPALRLPVALLIWLPAWIVRAALAGR